jgi:large subunit ribosomal protein L17
MLANMASSLILHKRITTTLAKAKALRQYVEPLITKSKSDTTHSRRTVFSYLKDKEAVTILFREIAEKVATRPGGYTRILKLANRLGDNAEMSIIELVDYNTTFTQGAEAGAAKKKSRRGGAASKAKVADAPVVAKEVVDTAPVAEEVVEEAPIVEEVVEVVADETPIAEEVVETPVEVAADETPIAEEVVETPVEVAADETQIAEEIVETPVAEVTEEAPAADAEEKAPEDPAA